MSIDDQDGRSSTSKTVRSPEFDDGLTAQDTARSTEQTTTKGTTSSFGTTYGNTGGRAAAERELGTGSNQADVAAADETSQLIAADKVQGTAVYDAAGERLGTIDSIMLGKKSGKVAYAIMSFGGFLGIGERYHPLPWNVLTYDEAKGGYNIQHSADDMRGAPNYSRDEVEDFSGGSRRDEIDNYYGSNVGVGAASLDAGYIGMTGGDGSATDGASSGQGSSGMASTAMGANRGI